MSLSKKSIGGSIHRVREFELEKVNLAEEFDILQIVGEGWFGKILLTEHKSTQTEMVLKALPKTYTAITDFYREFHYGLHLSAHRNIITTYDVAFETAGFYVFSQEYAPLGDLTANVSETGLGELHAKRVARQLAAAIHHIHSRELVHRDIKLDNVLVFKSDFSRIKLCDFGETRRINTIVRRHNEWLPYSPPEVLRVDTDETYKALTAHDVWQFGIVLFVCLTGCLPWQKAALDDRRYTRYLNWHSATLKIAKKPKLFQLISSRAQTMFSRLLEPKLEKRPVSVLEVNKYVEDRWLGKLGAEKALNGGADERDELCPSMYSFHSSLEEKNQLLYTLTRYGIETTVDRSKKKDRIREWIQASAIAEENEDEDSILEELDKLENSDNDNEVNMKGRHFPERKPSVKTPSPERPVTSAKVTSRHEKNGREERRHRKHRSTHRPSLKNLERKIPFAPQVASEMQTIARFSSFPNGDPSFGINASYSLPSLTTGLKNEDLQPVRQSGPLMTGQVEKSSSVNAIVSKDDRIPDPLSTRGTSSGANSFDNLFPPNNLPGVEGPKRVDINRSNSATQEREVINYHQNIPQSPLPPARKNKTQIASSAPQSPRQSPQVERNPAENINSKVQNNQSFFMSPFAGQLVMQSFKTIQGVTQHASKPVASSYNKRKENERHNEKKGGAYGKDPYEHYGVAQGVSIKPEINKQRGSPSGSGSRSVSN